MNKISKLNVEGQQIYVGMDVHKKSWSISILISCSLARVAVVSFFPKSSNRTVAAPIPL